MAVHSVSRRHFLTSAYAALGAAGCAKAAWGQNGPRVVRPRATDGDSVHEPDWQERLQITVGPHGADLTGKDDRVIQAALDYMSRMGGGTVRLLPGTYTLRAAVQMPSRVRLLGSGPETVITKIPSETVRLASDSDWYDQEITLEPGHAFQVGDSVVLEAKNPHNGSRETIKRQLVARSGNRFKLNNGIRKNLWLSGDPTCSSLFPLLTSHHTADVRIENLTLDGNGENNRNFNGNYGGCIFLQDCNRYVMRKVSARNYNGDGISFQVCHDMVVDTCHCHDNANLGVHPGSGSQRPRIINSTLENNSIGIFWCWGVKFGLAEGNTIRDNTDYGISIGHCDTDNVIRNNDITDSGKVGILFRDDARGQDFWPNRNLVENNRIIDSGGESGTGIDIRGKTRDVDISHNAIRETRAPARRTGIRIGQHAGRINLAENILEGFAIAIADFRRDG